MRFRKGASVRVKAGVTCPDAPDLDISGWQGRVADARFAYDKTDPVVGIAWDSITLQAMPVWFIEQSEAKGLDFASMYLSPDEIEPASPRDTESDVERVREKLEALFSWSWLGAQGKRIGQVVARAKSTDEMSVLRAWEMHLSRELRFPFKAEVDEYQESGPLRAGDLLTVLGIEMVHDLYGIIVACRQGRVPCDVPLADLEVVDKNSPNYQLVDDYRVWFANRWEWPM